jgi:hypothetical protein
LTHLLLNTQDLEQKFHFIVVQLLFSNIKFQFCHFDFISKISERIIINLFTAVVRARAFSLNRATNNGQTLRQVPLDIMNYKPQGIWDRQRRRTSNHSVRQGAAIKSGIV